MTRRLRVPLLVFAMLALTVGMAAAVTPDEMLDDPVLEERARDISAGLRCMVCQNQSIDESNAELAKDLRLLVRQRLVDGDSNDEVVEYIVSRYGEFVLLRPRFSAETMLLWVMPAVVLLIGAAALMISRRNSRIAPSPLTAEERSEIDKVLQTRDRDS